MLLYFNHSLTTFFFVYTLIQVCDRSEKWKEGRFEENAQRLPKSHVLEKGLQGTKNVVFFQT